MNMTMTFPRYAVSYSCVCTTERYLSSPIPEMSTVGVESISVGFTAGDTSWLARNQPVSHGPDSSHRRRPCVGAMNVYEERLIAVPGLAVWFGIGPSSNTDLGTLRLTGELDFSCADRLYAVLGGLRHEGRCHVLLDLSDLAFLSAAGVGALARAATDYADMGGSLVLTGPTRPVARMLALTGMHHLIRTTPAVFTATPS